MFHEVIIQQLSINTTVTGNTFAPVLTKGWISDRVFVNENNSYILSKSYTQPVMGGDIGFSLPTQEKKYISCRDEGTGVFFLKFKDDIPETVPRTLKNIRVYWDKSASMDENADKNFNKFLQRIVKRYAIEQVFIIPFNHKLMEGKMFSGNELHTGSWRKFTDSIEPHGATNFGNLDFDTPDDMIFVFTDGQHTWGNKNTNAKQTPVNFITTKYQNRYYYNRQGDYSIIQ
jgi:hypothetical protein